MALTKEMLIDSIYNQTDIKRQEAIPIVESLLEIIKRTLESGEDVLFSGFGKFSVKEKGERKGRNPQTADDMILRERRVVVFQCSGVLRERING